MSKTFASEKLTFLLAVATDRELPKLASRVAILFATRYMRSENDGLAWPAVSTIGNDLGVSADSAIRSALSALVSRGHLTAERRVGDTTRFRIANPSVKSGAPPATKMGGGTASKDTGVSESDPSIKSGGDPSIKRGATPPIFQAETPIRNEATSTVHESPIKKPYKKTPLPAIISSDLSCSRIDPDSANALNGGIASEGGKSLAFIPKKSPAKTDLPEGFTDFWDAYLKKVDKADAIKAYRSALKRGATPSLLVERARQYALERNREPNASDRMKYTRSPARWLNADSWADEPATASKSTTSAGYRHTRALFEDIN